MFRDAYQRLDLSQIAAVLEDVNSALSGFSFDPVETEILSVDIPFYPGFSFFEVSSTAPGSTLSCYAVRKPGKAIVLDFTNVPVYALNKTAPLRLEEENVGEYVRFFFTYVRGRHGRFLISENVDDIAWKEEPPPAARMAIGKILKPIMLKTMDSAGTFHLVAHMMFKDSLFRSDVNVTKEGFVTLENEELLVEDIPVFDDILGQ
ncbi:MAG: hypothetical protein K9G62_00040 [Alphaproteobacteria bacterium]|nr:hypothetical protein [Alphaproteobacteria bacterium]